MPATDIATELRKLPSVDRLLAHPDASAAAAGLLPELATRATRDHLAALRRKLQDGQACPELDEIARDLASAMAALQRLNLLPVINATGVVIHTNLGRAPLSQAAIEAMQDSARGYSNLEFRLATGARGSRGELVRDLLCLLTGAEDALVVNNNAFAVYLGLAALAKGKQVIVSRGQAVEIGGGFRIPDVLRQSGARLVEVGTTNRTRLADYAEAITPRTAAILRVHTSNFRVIGFTEATPLHELAALAREEQVLLLDDLGSGCLLDTTAYGLAKEPTPQESIGAGVDVAFFSGDKLLGGPQAGIAVGRREAIGKLARHPLARALRLDKMHLAALAATLLHYARGEAPQQVPVWRMIALPLAAIEERSLALAAALTPALSQGERATGLSAGRSLSRVEGQVRLAVSVDDGLSTIGGGSLPGETIPTKLVAIAHPKPERLAARLRTGAPPVVARVEAGRLLLDLRTVLPEQDALLTAALKQALGA